MPKKSYKIEDFSGGINQLADPRDIGDNQFEELFNADVSRVGKITLPGNALNVHQVTNILNKIVGLGWGFQNLNPFPNFQLRLRVGGVRNKTSSHKIG